jgi:hypothetical protein
MDSHLDAVLGRNVSLGRHGQDESDLPVSHWREHEFDVSCGKLWYMPPNNFLKYGKL